MIVNDDLESIWKEKVMFCFNVLTIKAFAWRDVTKMSIRTAGHWDRVSNPGLPHYEAGVPMNSLRSLVRNYYKQKHKFAYFLSF